jgi:pimeloyl-ACP methyl ester carboxylesterase
MATSMPAPAPLHLQSDKNTPLSVSYLAGSSSAPLIVFLTGLARPASSFDASIAQLLKSVASLDKQPGILVWDRYGQGLSGKQDKMHDAADVVETLRELLTHLIGNDLDKRALLLVGK